MCFFTIATEIRFIELDNKDTNLTDEEKKKTKNYKLSEIYHLKSIEIGCKFITANCPYINHLVTSYHKHYN